jgi:hypothetical protein
VIRRYRQLVRCLLPSPYERNARIAQRQNRWYFISSLRVSALLALSFLLMGWFVSGRAAGQAESADSKKSTVRGVVVNSVTHEPVGHALVYSPDNRFATLTDDQGRFEFALPEATSPVPDSMGNTTYSINGLDYIGASYANFPWMLAARKPGFLGLDQRTRVWENIPVVEGKDVTVTLVPEARIVGRVVLPTSNASDRIRVDLYHRHIIQGRSQWAWEKDAAARSNGEFRFADLEAGTYKLLTGELMDRDPLTVDPRGPIFGYPPVYFPNALDFQSAGEIQLTAGATFQAELSPVRQPYYPVKVPVTNGPTDNELMVSVSVHGRKGPGFELGYNTREQRIEGSLPNGTYVVEALSQVEMAATGSTTITVRDAALEAPPMTLVSTGSVHIEAKLEFKPDSETSARNENVNENIPGEAQPSVQGRGQNFSVMLEPADELMHPEMPNGPSEVAQNGDAMVFGHVPPGRYWVRVNASRGFAATVTSGEVDLLRRPLTVGPGSNLKVHVTLREDGGEISGSVEGGSGLTPEDQRPAAISFTGRFLPKTGTHIYCIPLPESTGQFREGTAQPDGKFSLQQIPPGSYRVLAFDRQKLDLEYNNAEAMRAYERKGQVVRLSASQKENITLQVISTSE